MLTREKKQSGLFILPLSDMIFLARSCWLGYL